MIAAIIICGVCFLLGMIAVALIVSGTVAYYIDKQQTFQMRLYREIAPEFMDQVMDKYVTVIQDLMNKEY